MREIVVVSTDCFPGSSADKEFPCNAGDPSVIPRSARSPGEGIGCPLQYSWASLVAQAVKNPPAMQDAWVQSLGWEDPWRREKVPTPVFLPGEFHGQEEPRRQATVPGVAKSRTWLSGFHRVRIQTLGYLLLHLFIPLRSSPLLESHGRTGWQCMRDCQRGKKMLGLKEELEMKAWPGKATVCGQSHPMTHRLLSCSPVLI